MATKTRPYDVAETLRTPDEMAAYLEACIEEANGDSAFIAKALGDIAHAQGMTEIARQSGLSRESGSCQERCHPLEAFYASLAKVTWRLVCWVANGSFIHTKSGCFQQRI